MSITQFWILDFRFWIVEWVIPIGFEFDRYSLIAPPLIRGAGGGMKCEIEKANWYNRELMNDSGELVY